MSFMFSKLNSPPIDKQTTFRFFRNIFFSKTVFLKLFQTKDHLPNKRKLTDHLAANIFSKTVGLLLQQYITNQFFLQIADSLFVPMNIMVLLMLRMQ